jgi:O-antigen/teichoic acid export membrane protein
VASPARTLRHRAEDGALWVAVESLAYRLANLAAFVVISRLVTTEELGLAAIVNVMVATFSVFAEQGRGTAIIKAAETDQRHLSTTFWACLGTGAVLTATAFAAAPLIADLFGYDELVPLVRIASFVFLLHSIEVVPSALLSRSFDFRRLALRKSVAVVAGGIVGVTLAVLGNGAYALVFQLLTYAGVSALVMWTQLSWRPSRVFDRALLRRDRAITYPLLGMNLLQIAQLQLDKLLVALVLDPVALAYYTIATRALVVVEDVATTALQRVALPTFARLEERGRGASGAAVVRMTGVVVATVTALMLLLAALADPLIHVVFGNKWAPSIIVLQVLAVGSALRTATLIDRGVLIAGGRATTALLLNGLAVALTAAAVPIGGLSGITWVAAGIAARDALMTPLRLWFMCRVTELRGSALARHAARPLLASGLGAASAWGVSELLGGVLPAPLVLVLCGLLGVAVTGGLLRLIAADTYEDLTALARRLLRRGSSAVAGGDAVEDVGDPLGGSPDVGEVVQPEIALAVDHAVDRGLEGAAVADVGGPQAEHPRVGEEGAVTDRVEVTGSEEQHTDAAADDRRL